MVGQIWINQKSSGTKGVEHWDTFRRCFIISSIQGIDYIVVLLVGMRYLLLLCNLSYMLTPITVQHTKPSHTMSMTQHQETLIRTNKAWQPKTPGTRET